MEKTWENTKIECYLGNEESEKLAKQNFNNVKQTVTDTHIDTLATAIESLTTDHFNHAFTVERSRFEKTV